MYVLNVREIVGKAVPIQKQNSFNIFMKLNTAVQTAIFKIKYSNSTVQRLVLYVCPDQ